MSSLHPGSRAAVLSVGLGVIAIVAWYAITRFNLLEHVKPPAGLMPETEASEAEWVVLFVALGIVGALSGLVALVRARGWTRLGALVGILLAALAIFVGTLPL